METELAIFVLSPQRNAIGFPIIYSSCSTLWTCRKLLFTTLSTPPPPQSIPTKYARFHSCIVGHNFVQLNACTIAPTLSPSFSYLHILYSFVLNLYFLFFYFICTALGRNYPHSTTFFYFWNWGLRSGQVQRFWSHGHVYCYVRCIVTGIVVRFSKEEWGNSNRKWCTGGWLPS